MQNEIFCWNCKEKLDLPKKIPFRALCDKCSFYQHCCKNCNYYQQGLPNDCKIPGTEPITDRATMNYCEEFSLKMDTQKSKNLVEDIENRLFGSKSDSTKKDFNSLFKED